jgi:hypothetical protein
MVKNVKSSLRKTLGSRSLTRSELEVTLIEIEACVNSRPLTFVGDSASSTSPLSPSHFLIGRSFYESIKPFEDQVVDRELLVNRKFFQDLMLNKFWSLWSDEYLRSLPPWKGGKHTAEIMPNSVVIVREDNQPRLNWPIGVISEVLPGRDGVVRACKVRVKGTELVRPVQRLHMLEIVQPIEEGQPSDSDSNFDDTPGITLEDPSVDHLKKPDRVSRFGRKIKSVQKLDI